MATLRKLYQQGNSVVVSIPTYMMDDMGLEIGDHVALCTTPRPSIEIHPMPESSDMTKEQLSRSENNPINEQRHK